MNSSKSKGRESKLLLGLNNFFKLSKTLNLDSSSSSSSSSARAGNAVRFSVAVSGGSTRTDYSSLASSAGLQFSKNLCTICLGEMKRLEGQAIFTGECSHSFHFQCIMSNLKHGNRVCPLCRFKWKQVPDVGGKSSSSFLSSERSIRVSEPTVYNDDDEILSHGNGEIGHDCVNDLEVKLYPEVAAVPKSASRKDFAVLINLKATGAKQRPVRAPVDLIAVLDVSGSMSGTKLALLHRAMVFLIQNLGSTDRLSVITFSSTAHRLFPLKLMSQTGKRDALQAINSLVANGKTNITGGLRLGAKVIRDRKWKNPVSRVMLLSDGKDGKVRSRTDYESLLPSSCPIPIHTFGFGLDHDAELLHTVSEISRGTFSFIEDENVILQAFAQCIGGLLSVVVQDLRAEIECVHQRLKICSIKSGSYRTSTGSNRRTGAIDIGDLYAEEERDFLVILEIPKNKPGSMSLLQVKCVYIDPITKQMIKTNDAEVTIQRPPVMAREEQSAVSVEVDRQRNRFLAVQVMSEARVLAEQGQLNRAMSLLETRRREISQTVSAQAGDRLCQALVAELLALLERMKNWSLYESSGRGYALSSMSSHSLQRATAHGDSTERFSSVLAYQTSAMADMVSGSQVMVFENPNLKPNRDPNPGPKA